MSIHHTAFKRVFGALKGFFIHICDIHIRNEFSNTNTQERVNSTFAGHTKPARDINSENSLVYRIFLLDYNYIIQHSGIGGKTPAEAAGIKIQGHNKWHPFSSYCVQFWPDFVVYGSKITPNGRSWGRTLPKTGPKPCQTAIKRPSESVFGYMI